MPETPFTVELPDGSIRACYSPSSIVKNYFSVGQRLPAAEFAALSRTALTEASERVRAKFGYACTAASASLHDIESWTGELEPDATLTVIHI